jgi:hypothetical protein
MTTREQIRAALRHILEDLEHEPSHEALAPVLLDVCVVAEASRAEVAEAAAWLIDHVLERIGEEPYSLQVQLAFDRTSKPGRELRDTRDFLKRLAAAPGLPRNDGK